MARIANRRPALPGRWGGGERSPVQQGLDNPWPAALSTAGDVSSGISKPTGVGAWEGSERGETPLDVSCLCRTLGPMHRCSAAVGPCRCLVSPAGTRSPARSSEATARAAPLCSGPLCEAGVKPGTGFEGSERRRRRRRLRPTTPRAQDAAPTAAQQTGQAVRRTNRQPTSERSSLRSCLRNARDHESQPNVDSPAHCTLPACPGAPAGNPATSQSPPGTGLDGCRAVRLQTPAPVT